LVGKTKRITFIAAGNAITVALTSYFKLSRVGLNCFFFEDPDMALVNASYMMKDDVAIAIISSGRTVNTLNPIRLSKKSGAFCIAITNYPHSPLAKICDMVFHTPAFAESLQGDILSERIAQMYVMESLYVALLLRRKSLLANLNSTLETIKINHV